MCTKTALYAIVHKIAIVQIIPRLKRQVLFNDHLGKFGMLIWKTDAKEKMYRPKFSSTGPGLGLK